MKSVYSDKKRLFLDFDSKSHSKMKKVFKKMINSIIIFIFFFTLNFQNSLGKFISKKEKKFGQFHSYEITIKIKGTGLQSILASDYDKCPDSLYIENSLINPLSSNCHFVNISTSFGDTNNLRLVWTNTVTNFSNMFHGLDNLLEVDLSKYDTSSINDMHEMFNNCNKITSINLNDVNTAKVNSMRLMFNGCSSLTELNLSSFDTSRVTDMYYMFANVKVRSLDIKNFDTSNVINMEGVFSNMDKLINLYLNFNTQKVTNMNSMFLNCFLLASLDITMFDTSSVTNMEYMFYLCDALTSLDLTNFNTKNVVNMHSMFQYCRKLTSLNLRNFNTSNVVNMNRTFYDNYKLSFLDISNFDISQVTELHYMFGYCWALTTLDVSSFDAQNAINMKEMFRGCKLIKSLNLSNCHTPKVIDMNNMFRDCYALNSLDVSNFDTSQVTDMAYMFGFCWSLTSLNLSSFDVRNVVDMNNMFIRCQKIKYLLLKFQASKVVNLGNMFKQCYEMISLDLSNFNTPDAVYMNNMFEACKVLTSLNLSKWHTPKVITMNNMFRDCYKLAFLDVSNFDTFLVTDMAFMFGYCYKITTLDLSNFRTPKLNTMEKMFLGCMTLSSLNIINFDTSQITDMHEIFHNCKSLTTLNLSSFDTSNTINMNNLFEECSSLITLDLSNFNTHNLKYMKGMFINCQSLKSVNLSSFDVSLVEDLEKTFYNCYNLTSLNLQNFIPSKAISMKEMFGGCKNLSYLNIENFDTSSVENMESMFSSCNSLTTIDVSSFNTKKVKTFKSMFYDCKELKILDLSNFDTNSLINASGMFNGSEKLEYINLQKYNETIDLPVNEILDGVPETIVVCLTNSSHLDNFLVELNKKLCLTIYCGDNWKTKQKIWRPMTNTCDIVEITDTTATSINSYKSNDIVSDDNSPLSSQIVDNTPVISKSSDISDKVSEGISYNKVTNIFNINTNINNEEIFNEVKNIIMQEYTGSPGEELIIEGEDNFIYQITTTNNEKFSLEESSNNTRRISKTDLGFCENILREYYHIDNNASLILIKFEKMTNISTEKVIQYEVYEPYNKTKLNLSLCDNTTITLYVPVTMSDELQKVYNQLKETGYDLFDINSAFYQDICVPFTSPQGTDVFLSDRIKYYYYNNETVCQSNCLFGNYSMRAKYLKCNCEASNSGINPKKVNKISSKTIYESFYDILKFSNYKVLFCYKLPFRINSIKTNKGSIMAIIYFCIYLIFLIIYCVKGISQFELFIVKDITENPMKQNAHIKFNNNVDSKKTIDNNSSLNETRKNIRPSIKSKSNYSFKNMIYKRISKPNIIKFPPKKNLTKILKTRNINSKQKNSDEGKLTYNNLLISNKLALKKNSILFKEKYTTIKTSKRKKDAPRKKLAHFELNNLSYKEALKIDKRNFFEMYWSLLRREHLIIFTFFIRNDYNLVFIKFARFIFLVCTDMALNVFFFSDDSMHKTYINYGKYNIMHQIPQIIYSTIVSQIIEVFLCYLSLTDKHYYQIKQIKIKSPKMKKNLFLVIKCVKLKIRAFFIFTFLMFGFYWYTITCFCSVYPNTQGAFIKDSISSFVLSLLYPFILYLFPAVFRLISIKANKINLSCLYKISDIIPFF